MTGNITTLRYLVDEVGVRTLNSERKGYTPLQMAVVWGQVEILVYLLTRGADPMLDSKSVVEQCRLRQERLQASLEKARQQPDSCNLDAEKIWELYEKGTVMLEILEGVEAFGSYRAWALKHKQHPLVRRFSWDLGDPEPRRKLAVLRVLVLEGRASLQPLQEREALEALVEKASTPSEALSKALAGLGFGVAMCRELQEAFRSATVEQLRKRRITREDFDAALAPVAMLSEAEVRRLWRFVLELQQKEKAKSAKAPKAKAKALMAVQKLHTKPQREQRARVDGMGLLFDPALPDPAFTLSVRFLCGLTIGR